MAAAEEQQAKRALKRLHVPKWLETATLLLPSGPARRPPKETLAMLRMLDTQCDLGQLLRQSSEPNMLLETISAPGQDSSSCVGWLGAVLKRYPATASALPVVTVCELLLANLGAAPTSFIAPPMVRVHRKEQSTMYGLATRLAQCIHSKNEWDGMLFFLQMIGHHNEQKRRLAVVALELLLVLCALSPCNANADRTALIPGKQRLSLETADHIWRLHRSWNCSLRSAHSLSRTLRMLSLLGGYDLHQ